MKKRPLSYGKIYKYYPINACNVREEVCYPFLNCAGGITIIFFNFFWISPAAMLSKRVNFLVWKIRKLSHYLKEMGFLNTMKLLGGKTKSLLTRKAYRLKLDDEQGKAQFLQIWHSYPHEKPAVALLVKSFFDLDGKHYLQGGAERYVVELNRIIQALGAQLEVYQCGNHNWHTTYDDIHVYGIKTAGFELEYLNLLFHSWVPNPQLTIYFQMFLSTPKVNQPSICVSHGVDWDAHWLQKDKKEHDLATRKVLAAISNVNEMVSVDTNTINWLRATEYGLSEKCTYIPNFVDLEAYFPVKKKSQDIIRLVFPRRLTEARGFWLLQAILPKLLDRYPNLLIDFCGKAEPFEEIEAKKLCAQFPTRVRWFDTPPDQMPQVYQSADLVVIPTRYSEGTSLACLEALACGKPVIATNVGGLPDIVLPDFNGILIEPNAEQLFKAICRLIESPGLQQELSRNALASIQAFDIKKWRARWEQILARYL